MKLGLLTENCGLQFLKFQIKENHSAWRKNPILFSKYKKVLRKLIFVENICFKNLQLEPHEKIEKKENMHMSKT